MASIQVFVEAGVQTRISPYPRRFANADRASFYDPNMRRSVCIRVQACETVTGTRDRCRRSECFAKPGVNEPSLQIALGLIKARRTDLDERRMGHLYGDRKSVV